MNVIFLNLFFLRPSKYSLLSYDFIITLVMVIKYTICKIKLTASQKKGLFARKVFSFSEFSTST